MNAPDHHAGVVLAQQSLRSNEVERASLRVALLTGGDDRSYALGLATSLMGHGVHIDFIGSDQVDGPELHGTPSVRFLNLRGDQSPGANVARKLWRLLRYYARLVAYAAQSRATVFHILWNNKFLHFDRTLLMLYYRALGHRVVMTAHNVNAAARDGHDSWLNRLTLRIQYHLCSQIFVHTPRMGQQLASDFGIAADRISIIPFGINNTSPTTPINGAQARQRLGLDGADRVMLFFGQIAPYKGLEQLVSALPRAFADDPRLRLVVAGKVKTGCEDYWRQIEQRLRDPALAPRVQQRIAHIPGSDVELYFKAADVLVIPYVQIFQSGVPFLAYSFGLPVIATDVGALRDDIIEGRTGLMCRPGDPADIARAIRDYFSSSLFANLARAREDIRAVANERHSWANVAAISEKVYRRVSATR